MEMVWNRVNFTVDRTSFLNGGKYFLNDKAVVNPC